jgi:LacI family transcriptional regulator
MRNFKKVILLVENSFSFDSQFLEGIAEYSRQYGPWRFFRDLPIYIASRGKRTSLEQLRQWGANGIIVREQKLVNDIIKMNLPTIVLPFAKKEFPRLPNVIIDNKAITKLAAEHFLDRGFRHFGYCGFDDYWWSRERGELFQKAIAKAGYKVHIYEQPRSSIKRSWENEQYIIANWLRSLPKPIGVMTSNDERGQHVIESCRIAQLMIPNHVAILGVGYDNLLCELSDPPLSSIKLNARHVGYIAAGLLDKMMTGKKVKIGNIFVKPVHIVVRQSTDIVAIDDIDVASALRFIHQQSKQPIQVNDVVNHTSVSRRVLERRFCKVINCSIYSEIRKVRMTQVARMLLETDMSISQIAFTMGYPGPDHIAAYFFREMGTTPGEYRKNYR